jgi:hypothetical protein
LLIPSHALSKAIRLTDEFEDVRAVSEPVQESSGEPFIAKDLCPIGEAQIGGEDEGHALVHLGAKLEDELRAGGRKRDETQFIEDDELVAQCGAQELGQAMFILSGDHLIDQSGCGVETYATSLTTGSEGQAGSDMSFAQAGISNQDDWLSLVDVLASGQVEDARFAQTGHTGEVKVGQFAEPLVLGA